MSRLMAAIGLAVMTSALGADLRAQTPPPPPPPPPPVQVGRDPNNATGSNPRSIVVGTAQIAGTVTDAETGQPIRDARVTLGGAVDAPGGTAGEQVTMAAPSAGGRGQLGLNRVTLTDGGGRFVFDRLPAGRFRLGADRSRYLTTTYGQHRPGGQGTAIAIKDGQRLDIGLALIRGGIITGTVRDEHGEPQSGAQMRAFRYAFANGAPRLQQVGGAMTDDRGQYRLFGLQPGDYIVSATPTASMVADQGIRDALAIEETIRTAPVQPPRSARDLPTVAVSGPRPPVPPGPRSTPPGWLPTYYPGTLDAGSATRIHVAGGDEHAGIDMVTEPARAANITGMVTPPPEAGVRVVVSVMDVDELTPGIGLSFVLADQDGRFVLRNLPPGRRELLAQTIAAPRAVQSGSPSGPPPQLDASQRLWGRASVVVATESEVPIVIGLEPGKSVSGTVTFEMANPPDLTRGRTTVSLSIAPGLQTGFASQPSQARVEPDGRFTVRGVIPGKYSVRTNAGMLKEVLIEGRDVLDFPLEITGERDIVGARLTVTDRSTELAGLLTDVSDQPAVDYSIVAASADPRYWVPGSRRIMTTRPDTAGRYSFRGLPPGDYLLAVVNDLEPGQEHDPEFLRALAGSAVRVTLTEGASQIQNLRIGS